VNFHIIFPILFLVLVKCKLSPADSPETSSGISGSTSFGNFFEPPTKKKKKKTAKFKKKHLRVCVLPLV
jgi:hypothetical protein